MHWSHHIVLTLAVGGLLAGGTSCRTQARGPGGFAADASSGLSVRPVRVLLVDGAGRCRLNGDGPFSVLDRAGRTVVRGPLPDWLEIRAEGDAVAVGEVATVAGPVSVAPDPSSPMILVRMDSAGRWGNPAKFAGAMVLSSSESHLRVINEVDIESYVSCVLAGELFPDFHLEAFRAQAVAVRTYSLYQMARTAGREYDVAATEASQVYPGLPTGELGRKTRAAADSTRGIVATWGTSSGPRIFCTFYSSCCGGVTQAAHNCKPEIPKIKPLSGGVDCQCGRIAKSYRWGPTRVSKWQVTKDVEGRYPKFRDLGRIERVEVSDKDRYGRPKSYRLVGSKGRRAELLAEDFRLAVGSRTMRSTRCTIDQRGNYFIFHDGRGFGHGMGMCQWGMQEMALEGYRAGQILDHYYPGMTLTRAY